MKPVKTLLPEQVSSRLLAETAPFVYKFHTITLGDQNSVLIEIGKELRDEAIVRGLLPANYSRLLSATSGFIYTSGDIHLELRYNFEDADVIDWSISELGNLWTLAQGDLVFTHLWLRNPSYSSGITIKLFLTGSPDFSM